MKKAVISTLLVIQLILLVLLTFSTIKFEKASFSNTVTVTSIAAFRLTSTYDAINEDMGYLRMESADNDTINQYIYFINSTFSNNFNTEITFNQTYLAIRDTKLGMQKATI